MKRHGCVRRLLRRGGRLLAAAVVLVAGSGAARAQTASFVGTVRDAETGRPLDGATVLVRGTPLFAITDARGRFAIIGIEAGVYALDATAIGFSGDSLPGIGLAEGERREVELRLQPVALRLQEVVVSASRAAERSEEAVASVVALAGEDIVLRNVTTLDQALVFVPGVTFNGKNQLDIRGAAGMARGVGSRVLMLLDGHSVLSGDGGEIDFGTIPMLDLDRTEIVKGAYSAVYGSNALGGVVNLITTPVDSSPETLVRVHADAYNYQPDYKWADGAKGAIGIGLQHARRLGSVGSRVALGYEGTNGFSENRESSRVAGRVKLESAPTSGSPWDVFGVFVRERAGEFFIWRSPDEPYEVPTDVAGNYTIGYTVLTGATVTPLATARTLIRVSPTVNFNSIQNYFNDNDDWHTAFKPGLLAQVSWFAGDGNSLTLGVEGSHMWGQSNFLGDPKILDAAGFVQDEIRFSDVVKSSVGARLDYHRASESEAEWAVSPKVGVAVRVAPRATIRASVGAGYRAPSAIEQFVSSQQFGFRVIPNPDLKGEHAWSGEIGTSVTVLNRIRLDAALFGSVYRDLIGPAPAPDEPFVFQFRNVSRARVAGADIGVNAFVIRDKLELQGSYLLLDTEDRDTGEPLPYRSRHNVTGTISVLRGLAGVDVRYRSRVEEVLAFPLDPRSNVTVIDLRFGYRALNLLWQLKVANIFNQFYVDVQERNPGAPRSIGITAVYGL
ncbi:MAG: TonB-dependent receptor [Gemmatimonadales bacterium]|nr:TonB-dependent receptor [Gemmatimonadales bacterium]